ncbi:hypothetical protein EC988_006435, partial [Linderina pennispora]
MTSTNNSNVPGNLDQRMAGLGVNGSNDNSNKKGKGGGAPKRYIPPHLRGKPPASPVDKNSAMERTASWSGDGVPPRDRSRSSERPGADGFGSDRRAPRGDRHGGFGEDRGS